MADNTAYQDLLKDTSESKENGNYFLITITDLNPNTSYPIEFRWMYSDKRVNDNWSAVKLITTPGESEPNTPKFTSSNVDVSSPEKIIITWDGTSDDPGSPAITNYDRVDVYIDGAPFDGTKAAYSFKSPGTTTISAPGGTYQIALYAVSKTGKLSPVSAAVTKTVQSAAVAVQTPTLPSGLSVATAPFAVTVNWNGAYSSSTFTGFKSIDIYAVGSDLGSTVTSGITSTNLVGSLTVNDTTNRINIGLDNLRQALGLTSNSDVYSATIFYYYNATNTNNVKYGSPTYTRINSSSVIPTKANFVDLASGVISIENLVAGNGQFSSWLRTGSAGGARIELSSVSDFTDNGYTVQKGLVAYSSGNTELFNLDLDNGSLTINGSGTFTGDLSAGSGSSIFKSDSNGIYLGSSTWAGAASTFRVSRNGVLAAASGTIGGWTLGSTYLQGNNLKLDTSGITIGSTSLPYLDISSTAVTHRNANGTASGKFTLDIVNSSLTLSGTIALNSSSTIDGTSTTDIKSGATSGSTALQSGNGISKNGSNQINQILLNSSGIGIYTATSGTRMQLTNSGLELWNGNTQTVGINATNGSAFFKGDITGASGTFGGTLSSSDATLGNWRVNSAGFGSNTFYHIVNVDNYWNGDTGILATNKLYIRESSGNTGISMLNGANILMSGGTISLSTGGTLNISGGSIISGAGLALEITGSTGNIYQGPSSYHGVNTTSGVASDYDDGVFAGSSGLLIARRDGSTITTSSVLFVHRYYDSSNTNPSFFRALRDGSTVGNLRYNTSTNTFETSTSSDYRLKENISEHNILNSAQIIKSIPIKRFSFKSDPDKNIVTGFIAHELQEVAPFAVSGEKDGADEEGNPDYQEVGFTSLIPDTVAALQYALNKIEELQQRLDALEA